MSMGNLITEISVKDAWTKFYSDKTKFPILNGNEELFNNINNLYTDNPNNFNKGFFNWLYNLMKNNKLKEEDFYKVKEYLRLFNKFINKIPKENRDINSYKSLPDLYAVIQQFEGNDDAPTSKQDEQRQIKEKEVKKVFEDDEWLIMVPTTERASCLIGKGTQWCTAADNNNMFDHYSEDGPLYVIVNKETNTKYQLHFESQQLMDETDRPISATHFFDYILEDDYDVVEFFQGANEGFWDFILETSTEEMADGGYSEIYQEALQNGSAEEIKDSLSTLRYGQDGDAVRMGFLYEDNPENISSYSVEALLEYHNEDEGFSEIIEHLRNIKFDFSSISDEFSLEKYLKAINDLKTHNLELQHNYSIDKNHSLSINSIDFKNINDSEGKYYNVTMFFNDRSNSNRSNLNIDTLLNYIHQGSLFESKSNKRFIKKLIRENLEPHGIVRLYHRIGNKKGLGIGELIKGVFNDGLVPNDNGEVGSVIWFSPDFKDYAEGGKFVVAYDYDKSKSYEENHEVKFNSGSAPFGFGQIPFDALKLIKVPVISIKNNYYSQEDVIKYINQSKMTPETFNKMSYEVSFFGDLFNRYVQPNIDYPNFLDGIDQSKIKITNAL